MIRVTAAAVFAAALWTAVLPAQSANTWRADGLASFDDVWQTINDTFYDPAFGGIDWNAVRQQLRPRAERAENADAIRLIIQEMLDRLRQSHFVLLSPSEALAAAARRHTSSAATSGPGEIVSFGNLPDLVVRTDVRELRSPGGRRVGFIGFNVWMTTIDAPVADAIDRFRTADAVIFDLRGNPGGLAGMISGIAGQVMDDSEIVLGRMQTRAGRLELHPNPRTVTADARVVKPYAGPVAILVDEDTGSTSECFAGALQGLGRARVFGRPTMGEALPALTKRLPNGDVLMYAIGNFVTAGGRSLEGGGVTPDEVVEAGAPGPDPVLRAALAWVDRASAGGKSLVD
jgi:C-terminal processing protease CtpA/Prc